MRDKADLVETGGTQFLPKALGGEATDKRFSGLRDSLGEFMR